MSSRGSYARNGHVTMDEFRVDTSKNIPGVKVLIPLTNNRSLPDYSHSKNAVYAMLKDDGKTLHAMRFYGEDRFPVIEIAYHREAVLDKHAVYILHYHTYSGLVRSEAKRMTPEIKERYATYLKEFGLYD